MPKLLLLLTSACTACSMCLQSRQCLPPLNTETCTYLHHLLLSFDMAYLSLHSLSYVPPEQTVPPSIEYRNLHLPPSPPPLL